jgi:hypothetical protein
MFAASLAQPESRFRQRNGMPKCPEYERITAEVENVLGNLAQVTTLLLDLFRSRDLEGVHRLDKQLELTVGAKERCLGALSQHIKEHKCVNLS